MIFIPLTLVCGHDRQYSTGVLARNRWIIGFGYLVVEYVRGVGIGRLGRIRGRLSGRRWGRGNEGGSGDDLELENQSLNNNDEYDDNDEEDGHGEVGPGPGGEGTTTTTTTGTVLVGILRGLHAVLLTGCLLGSEYQFVLPVLVSLRERSASASLCACAA